MPGEGEGNPSPNPNPNLTRCAELPFEPDEAEDGEMDEMQFVELARAADVRFEQPEWQGEQLTAARAFVRECMLPDPSRRPTAAEARRHGIRPRLAELRRRPGAGAGAGEG